MFRLIIICASFVLAANSAYSQSSPPNSDQAKRIQMLVVEQPNSSTQKERKHSPNFVSAEANGSRVIPTFLLMLPMARWSSTRPFRHARDTHTTEKKTGRGKAFHDEIIKTAQIKGSGWVDYWLPKPGQTEPSQKWSYVKAVKAEGVAVVGAGFFPE